MEPLWAANTIREPYRDSRLTIDFSNHAVTLDSESVSLTAKEYLLLSFLAAHTGEIGDGHIYLLPVSDTIRIRTGRSARRRTWCWRDFRVPSPAR